MSLLNVTGKRDFLIDKPESNIEIVPLVKNKSYFSSLTFPYLFILSYPSKTIDPSKRENRADLCVNPEIPMQTIFYNIRSRNLFFT